MENQFGDARELEIRSNVASMPTGALRKFYVTVASIHGAMGIVEVEKNLSEAAYTLSTDISKHTACRNRCSYCCHQAVSITAIEAARIANHLGIGYTNIAPISDVNEAIKAVYTTRDKYFGVPCTFLGSDGACGIYEVRPLECALLYNMSSTPGLCDPSKGVQNITAMDFGDVHMLRSFNLYRYNVPVADIREFFNQKGE